MSVFKLQTQSRSSSPSPAGFLRRHRSADAATEHSPNWRRGNPCRGDGGGGSNSRVPWASRPSLSPFERSGSNYRVVVPAGDDHVMDGRDGGNGNDDDDYWMCDDDMLDDEDGEGLSQEEARRSSWLRGFLARMGEMSLEEMGHPAVVTILCPACKGGPGGSQLYRGFQALLDHARSVMAKRVRLHRRFAEILEDELRLRTRRGREGDSLEQATASDGKSERLGGGPEGVAGDRKVPWPPMVVVLNTRLGKQEGSDKWVGMGNGDLMDRFREYEPVKARSAYGSHGHSGASLLAFDSTVLGYLQAQRLHGQFIQEGRGKYEWHKKKPWKQPTEKRLLYGYMVTTEEELSMFSTYLGDKHKLKYEMKPYQEVVGDPLKGMYGRSQKQALLEREIAKEIEQNKSLERTCELRGLEIEVMRRMLNEQSDEHEKEIASMNECNERLNSKLRESELERKKMQEQIGPLRAIGDDQVEASSTELANRTNPGDGDHGKLDGEMEDEITEEQTVPGTM